MATTQFIKGGDFKDEITAVDTDNANAPVNIANLAGFEVWYYTDRKKIFKFIREVPGVGSGKIQLLKKTDFEYVARLTPAQTLEFATGTIYEETYIALTDADMADGNFQSLGSMSTGIEVIYKPISNNDNV